jgi:putative protease
LRAYAGNFTDESLKESVEYAHKLGKKAYVTVNIIAHNEDFVDMENYIKYLYEIGVDAVIVADVGIISLIRRVCPNLDVHVSTQANITNKYAAKFFTDMGVKRLVLARELSVKEIKEIRDYIPKDVEIETFVHGAMCISYSGRCLLSNYLTNRDSNKGACVQACRWEYTIHEKSRDNEEYPIYEDSRGTYILNSKDLNMLAHIQELIDAGVTSFKIEGRMKSVYYVATVVNAYRRALDQLGSKKSVNSLLEELNKTSHRNYTTGFYFGSNNKECLESSTPVQTHEFMAVVLADNKDGRVLIEQRNRFKVGDTLEVLSPNNTFNKLIEVESMLNEKGEEVPDALGVQQKLYLKTKLKLMPGDILRKQITK